MEGGGGVGIQIQKWLVQWMRWRSDVWTSVSCMDEAGGVVANTDSCGTAAGQLRERERGGWGL